MGITPLTEDVAATFFTAKLCTVRITKNGSTSASFVSSEAKS